MFDTAAMFDTSTMEQEFQEPIADSPAPRPISSRPPSQLVKPQVAPAQPSFAWATPKNLILAGLGVASAGILIAAFASSQPKPAEPIVPLKVVTLNDAAPKILLRNTEERKKTLDEANDLARQALAQADNTAVRVNATKELLDAEEAVKKGDKQCLRSYIGRNCLLNIRETAWYDRLVLAIASKDADQIAIATGRLRAIEIARLGKVEIVDTDLEVVKLALRDRYNARLDAIQAQPNESARVINKNKL